MRTRNAFRWMVVIVGACAGALVGSASTVAQPSVPGRPSDPPAKQEESIDLAKLHPAVRLGLRVEIVRRRVPVVPTLVIVETAPDYVEQLSMWRLDRRWPVLIDDGSPAAAENIARFARGFAPKTIVRWKKSGAEKWPTDIVERGTLIELAASSAWGASSRVGLRQAWEQLQFAPPGVVVASPGDPAWTAGAALAAAHGQEIIWASGGNESPSGVMSDDALASLLANIERELDLMPHQWRGLGDAIEAVTLCLNVPARINSPDKDLALTDRVGRAADGSRWAWCGMIFGDEQAAAYRAMCSIFLQSREAWLFDGYAPDFAPPYRVAPAVELLTKAGFEVSANVAGRSGARDWRERLRRGVRAGLIHVNSAGLPESFLLNPGYASYADVPLLRVPSVVHFIHSFSAQRAADAETIAGRFLMNGAYAYCGSVHEPFLGAFEFPERFMARMLAPMPFGAAPRHDGFKLWKLNVFGDPLLTLGPAAPRSDATLELEHDVPLDDELRDALKGKDFRRAARALVMLGRDGDVVRLGRAVMKDDAKAMTPDLALALLPAAFREGESAAFLDLFEALRAGFDGSGRPLEPARLSPTDYMLSVDLLWQFARQTLDDTRDERLVTLLMRHCRPKLLAEDGGDLAPAIVRVYGVESARAFLAGLAEQTADEHQKSEIRKVSAKF